MKNNYCNQTEFFIVDSERGVIHKSRPTFKGRRRFEDCMKVKNMFFCMKVL